MKNISIRVKIMGIVSILLWIIGSLLIFNETNGKSVSIATAIIIITGLYSQVNKDRNGNSEFKK